MLPHADAAHRLARWLTKNEADAADVLQEAWVRAFRHFDGYRGGDSRTWLLAIVRRCCFTFLEAKGRLEQRADDEGVFAPAPSADPEQRLLEIAQAQEVNDAILMLSTEHREVVVLRELDGLSYKEIAEVTGQALGTVMSRLNRGRERLRALLSVRSPMR